VPYFNVDEVESALLGLQSTFPLICQSRDLPNTSVEGRVCRAVRIGSAAADHVDAVLLTGAVHAREWGGAEICVNVAADLCEAYTGDTGLGYGGKSFTADEVRTIVDDLNVIIFPQVNPDGRHFSQTSQALWRRNRNPAESGGNPTCIGVDLNRNQDFLWDFPVHFDPESGVATSDNPCSASQTYRGSAAASEPETQNVVSLLDTYPRIRWYLDVHCSGEKLLFAWGDDRNQSTDCSMSFANPAFDGMRGLGSDSYGEFIPKSDLSDILELGMAFHDALFAVRDKDYSVEQAYDLYPTSGANDDYAYGRHFTDPSKSAVLGFTIEYGTDFQPAWSEMERIIADVSAGILGFCLKAHEKSTAPAEV
jgi:murein tripeptide amidase MpaA